MVGCTKFEGRSSRTPIDPDDSEICSCVSISSRDLIRSSQETSCLRFAGPGGEDVNQVLELQPRMQNGGARLSSSKHFTHVFFNGKDPPRLGTSLFCNPEWMHDKGNLTYNIVVLPTQVLHDSPRLQHVLRSLHQLEMSAQRASVVPAVAMSSWLLVGSLQGHRRSPVTCTTFLGSSLCLVPLAAMLCNPEDMQRLCLIFHGIRLPISRICCASWSQH